MYVDSPPRYKVWLIDINAWIPLAVDALLFDFEELNKIDTTSPQNPTFRVIEDDIQMKASDMSCYRVPMDFENVEAMQAFMEQM